MIMIEDFIENEIEITWTLLNIGFDRCKEDNTKLSEQDIVNYAISKMEDGDETLDVVLLASAHTTNSQEISQLLKKLSENENVNIDFELKKWRVIYVLKYLPDIQDEYINGLIELGDIWVTFNFPDDSPHVYQGRNNTITPEEYYTRDNYERLIMFHRKWIEEEMVELKKVRK